MIFDHRVVMGFLFAVIIPIDQFDVGGNMLFDFLDLILGNRRIRAVICQSEIHIRPHHRLEAVLFGNLQHFLQMPL